MIVNDCHRSRRCHPKDLIQEPSRAQSVADFRARLSRHIPSQAGILIAPNTSTIRASDGPGQAKKKPNDLDVNLPPVKSQKRVRLMSLPKYSAGEIRCEIKQASRIIHAIALAGIEEDTERKRKLKKARDARWRAKMTPEQKRKRQDQKNACNAKRRKDHPDKVYLEQKRWRLKNPQKMKALQKAWIEKNRDKMRAYWRKRKTTVEMPCEGRGATSET